MVRAPEHAPQKSLHKVPSHEGESPSLVRPHPLQENLLDNPRINSSSLHFLSSSLFLELLLELCYLLLFRFMLVLGLPHFLEIGKRRGMPTLLQILCELHFKNTFSGLFPPLTRSPPPIFAPRSSTLDLGSRDFKISLTHKYFSRARVVSILKLWLA